MEENGPQSPPPPESGQTNSAPTNSAPTAEQAGGIFKSKNGVLSRIQLKVFMWRLKMVMKQKMPLELVLLFQTDLFN